MVVQIFENRSPKALLDDCYTGLDKHDCGLRTLRAEVALVHSMEVRWMVEGEAFFRDLVVCQMGGR